MKNYRTITKSIALSIMLILLFSSNGYSTKSGIINGQNNKEKTWKEKISKSNLIKHFLKSENNLVEKFKELRSTTKGQRKLSLIFLVGGAVLTVAGWWLFIWGIPILAPIILLVGLGTFASLIGSYYTLMWSSNVYGDDKAKAKRKAEYKKDPFLQILLSLSVLALVVGAVLNFSGLLYMGSDLFTGQIIAAFGLFASVIGLFLFLIYAIILAFKLGKKNKLSKQDLNLEQ